MRQPKVGILIKSKNPSRDAIHMAIAPVIAGSKLAPGEHIGIMEGTIVASKDETPIGIVDPFLNHPVQVGEKFYLFLYPNTITSLRHDWTHPAFGGREQARIVESERWLREYAEQVRTDYDELLGLAEGREVVFGITTYPDPHDEMWDHLEVVTGRELSMEERRTLELDKISCSC